MKILLATLTLLLAVQTLGPWVSVARADDPPKNVEPEKEKATTSIDTRIESLQNAKDCITTAKTKTEIDSCRRSVHLKAHSQ